MKVNLPPKVRFAIYVAVGFGSVVVGYLQTKNYIGVAEVNAWAAITAFAGGLAALNTDTGLEE